MIRQWVLRKCEAVMASRPYDFAIGPGSDRYCLRWWIIPRNRWFNIYLHRFLHDDEDRALHDHPWYSMSWLLKTGYYEVLRNNQGAESSVWRPEGTVTFRRATQAHRIVLVRRWAWHSSGLPKLIAGEATSLFITGPVIRNWGFYCPKGWRPWQEFVDQRDTGAVGRGCD